MTTRAAEFLEMRLPASDGHLDSSPRYLIRIGDFEVVVPRGFDSQELLVLLSVVREVAS